MAINIREASMQDYDALCQLIDQVDQLHRDRRPELYRKPDGPVRTRDYILGLITDANVGLFVAEAEGRIVGFVNSVVRESAAIPIFVVRRYVVVDNLGVAADARRRGIGKALMETVCQWAAAQGATAVELIVLEFNLSAMSFYQALGFETASRKLSIPLK